MKRFAVVGGGITWLAAAYELRCCDDDADVVVHEASPRAGGKVRTSEFAGRAVDEGADAFLARVPWGLDLCRELGIDTTLVSPAASKAYVWWDGALRAIPPGTVLGVPTDPSTFDAPGLVDGPLVARPAAAPLAEGVDVSVGALVRPQLGDDLFERLVDPLIGGINAGDCDHLSVRAVAPQLAAAAERDEDLTRGLRTGATAPQGPVFHSPVGGMGALVDALLAWLRAHRVDVRTSSQPALTDLDADEVVVTTPAYEAARMLDDVAPRAAKELASIAYASVAMITLAYPRHALGRELDGSGFLVPRGTGLLVTACSWSSSKWAQLAPAEGGSIVVRASVGRIDDERFVALDDDALVQQVTGELATTSALRGAPVDVRVTRWLRSFPQYEPGHLERVASIERLLEEEAPHVVVTGAAFRGLGVPACIRQGREAAVRAAS